MVRLIRYTLTFILLFVAPILSQTSPRLDSITAAVREQVGSASVSVTRAINRAYQQVCTDYPAYELIDTVILDSTTPYATLASDFDRLNTVDLLSENKRYPLRSLEALSPDSIKEIVQTDMEDTDPTDQKFYNVFGGYLWTYPRWARPDTATFEVKYFAIGAALSAVTDSVKVASSYRNAVFLYACAEVQRQRGKFSDANAYLEACWLIYGKPAEQLRGNR